MSITWESALALFACGLIGGGINAMAGGGTLVTFPLLVGLGFEPRVANATNLAALWPGTAGAAWGYRRDMANHPLPLRALCLLTIAGGLCGATLLLCTSGATFARLAPFLVWFATLLVLAQEVRPLWQRQRSTGPTQTGSRLISEHAALRAASLIDAPPDPPASHLCQPTSTRLPWPARLVWLALGIYGGYFGAGVSIMMLGAAAWCGVDDIHHANAAKNLLGVGMNLIAVVVCTAGELVRWPQALLIAAGALLGGYLGARFARRQHPRHIRLLVVAVGLLAGLRLYVHGSV